MKLQIPLILSLVFFSLCSCSSGEQPKPATEYYAPAYRQLPPEPVYGRLMWHQLEHPILPAEPSQAPYLSPELSFEMPNSTLSEATQALGQTIGYEVRCPSALGSRKVSIKLVGTIDQVISAIESQAHVRVSLLQKERVITVVSKDLVPKLPEVRNKGSLPPAKE